MPVWRLTASAASKVILVVSVNGIGQPLIGETSTAECITLRSRTLSKVRCPPLMPKRAIDVAFGKKETWLFAPHMSAIGPKRTSLVAPTCPLSAVKRTWSFSEFRFRGRYWGQTGHGLLQCKCPLMIQSGQQKINLIKTTKQRLAKKCIFLSKFRVAT